MARARTTARRGAVLALALLVRLGAVRAAEDLARFLPPATALYGGVRTLGPTFDKATAAIQKHIALPEGVNVVEQAVAAVREALELDGLRTRAELVAAFGLDEAGTVGLAQVLTDPSTPQDDELNTNLLLILPVRDPARLERLVLDKVAVRMPGYSRTICSEMLRRIARAKKALTRVDAEWARGPVTWETLIRANPGLQKLRCPADDL